MTKPYDAILILSFGGPESMNDVMPFLKKVTEGRNVPEERLLEVAKHYEMFGGVSPINAQNRDIIERLRIELKNEGPDLPIYFGNRNWHPFLEDCLRTMKNDGIKNAFAFVTSAYSSYSSCRQYLDDINKARTQIENAPEISKIRPFYNHPLFIEANAENLQEELQKISPEKHKRAHIAFTAHSIPLSMAESCSYESQLREAAGLVAEMLDLENEWQLVYQSRSGPPSVPWLEPDILEYIKQLKSQGLEDLIIHPLGFVSDHMEVIYDLDHEAAGLCKSLGINLYRSRTAGTNAKFIQMIRELLNESISNCPNPAFVGNSGALPDQCPENCCPMPRKAQSVSPVRGT